MTARRGDIAGIDDCLAERALARRARHHEVGEAALCGRRFTHPCLPTQFDALGYLVVQICVCLRLAGHEHGCLCGHRIERIVYRVDDDGREHYATLPLRELG
jgi:hypothetical protein